MRPLAPQASHISGELEAVKEALEEAGAKWRDSMKQMGEKWTLLNDLLRDHGSSNTPKKEMLNLLACGIPSPAMRQFLSASMGTASLALPSRGILTPALHGARHYTTQNCSNTLL